MTFKRNFTPGMFCNSLSRNIFSMYDVALTKMPSGNISRAIMGSRLFF